MTLKRNKRAMNFMLMIISACCCLISLSACQSNKVNSVDDYKMAIWDSDKIAVFDDYDLNEFKGNIARKKNTSIGLKVFRKQDPIQLQKQKIPQV